MINYGPFLDQLGASPVDSCRGMAEFSIFAVIHTACSVLHSNHYAVVKNANTTSSHASDVSPDYRQIIIRCFIPRTRSSPAMFNLTTPVA